MLMILRSALFAPEKFNQDVPKVSEQDGFIPEKIRLDLSGVKQLGMMNISELDKISEKDVNP